MVIILRMQGGQLWAKEARALSTLRAPGCLSGRSCIRRAALDTNLGTGIIVRGVVAQQFQLLLQPSAQVQLCLDFACGIFPFAHSEGVI